MSLPDTPRAALRELLAKELTEAWNRARHAGCPPAVLAEVFASRSRSVAEGSGPAVAGEGGG
jgi:hypothetical protein